MTCKEIELCVQSLVDGSLSEGEFAELQAELRKNAKSREFFRLSMEVEMLLMEVVGSRLPQLHSQLGSGKEIDALLNRRQRRRFSKTLMAAAALVIIGSLALIALLTGRQSEPASLAYQAVAGTRWAVESSGSSSRPDLLQVVAGSTVSVQSGTVRLEDDSGVVMLLHGPAEVSFPKLDQPVLRHGWLWVDSSESEAPFVVDTSAMKVRDIGTRFGLRVHPGQQVEIHMIEGLVEATGKQPASEIVLLKPKKQGFLLVNTGEDPVELPLAPDPFLGLKDLLASEASYHTTVLSQAPTGYWPLDEQDGESLRNEVPGGIDALIDDEIRYNGERYVATGVSGVGSDDGFDGFHDENRAVHLSGQPHKSLIHNLDIEAGVSREEGSVSFWIRREPKLHHREILWLAGTEGPDPADRPETAMIYIQLTPSGRAELFIENGEIDLLLSSNIRVVDGDWHHIAASWGPDAVELYVDGRRTERVDDYGSLRSGTYRGRNVRFGKPSIDLRAEGARHFNGWVDDIAIWRRPLAGIEIADQYEAAKGTGFRLPSSNE